MLLPSSSIQVARKAVLELLALFPKNISLKILWFNNETNYYSNTKIFYLKNKINTIYKYCYMNIIKIKILNHYEYI